MKGQLDFVFHNPNDEGETAKYLCDLLVDMLLDSLEENPNIFFEFASLVIDGGNNEDCSIL